jgi:predicted amidohydrolase
MQMVSRRNLLARSLGGAASASAVSFAQAAGTQAAIAPLASQPQGNPAGLEQRTDGGYRVIPLRQEAVTLSLCQSRVRAVVANNPGPGRRENLAHMLELIDNAQRGGLSPHKDLLMFHEFPITGYTDRWDRADALRVAIEFPGEESAAIGARARQHNCYIVFGSYVRDQDWPNHVLSLTTIIAPDGRVAGKSWKARNIKGVFGANFELFTSTIFDNFDRFVEMYGADAVVPVLRTDIGNITTTSTQREPELARAAAMKGCELFLRTASGGFSELDVQATAYYNGIYSCVVNNAVSPDNPSFFAGDAGFGGTAIYGPQGELLAKAAPDNAEQQVVARIPMADYRRRHRQPLVHMELWRPVFDRYVSQYPPNLYAATLPANPQDAAKYMAGKSRWAP